MLTTKSVDVREKLHPAGMKLNVTLYCTSITSEQKKEIDLPSKAKLDKFLINRDSCY